MRARGAGRLQPQTGGGPLLSTCTAQGSDNDDGDHGHRQKEIVITTQDAAGTQWVGTRAGSNSLLLFVFFLFGVCACARKGRFCACRGWVERSAPFYSHAVWILPPRTGTPEVFGEACRGGRWKSSIAGFSFFNQRGTFIVLISGLKCQTPPSPPCPCIPCCSQGKGLVVKLFFAGERIEWFPCPRCNNDYNHNPCWSGIAPMRGVRMAMWLTLRVIGLITGGWYSRLYVVVGL